MTLLAKANAGGIQIERGVTLRLQGARQVAGAAAVAAAHFEYIFAAQFHLRGDVMIKLDPGAIRFVSLCQRDSHRRFFVVGVVEKENFFAVQPPGQKWIPKLPDGLSNPADGEQMINNRHGELFRKMVMAARLGFKIYLR